MTHADSKETTGGKTIVDEMLGPYITDVVIKLANAGYDSAIGRAILGFVTPHAKFASAVIPGVFGAASGHLPAKIFGSTVAASIAKQIVSETGRNLRDVVEKRAAGIVDATPEEKSAAVEAAAKAVLAKKQFVQTQGVIHLLECKDFRLLGVKPKPEELLSTSEALDLLAEKKAFGLPCCMHDMQTEFAKPPEAVVVAAPKPASNAKSWVVTATPEQRGIIITWMLDSTDPEETAKRSAFVAKHLDPHEVEMLVESIKAESEQPGRVAATLKLIENTSVFHGAAKHAEKLGRKVEEFFREVDESFAPVVQRLEANEAAPRGQRVSTFQAIFNVQEDPTFWEECMAKLKQWRENRRAAKAAKNAAKGGPTP